MKQTARPKLPQNYQNKINNAQGHTFEASIQQACQVYFRLGEAAVEKTPEPFRVIAKEKSGGIFRGRFTARAQPDFQGTLQGGISIVFEAKYTTTDRLRQNVVTDKQAEALERHRMLGAAAFVCAGIRGRFFMVPWELWRDMEECFGHRYVTAESLAPWQVKFDGAVRFLEYVPRCQYATFTPNQPKAKGEAAGGGAR